jgi:hypothetical protein
MGRVKFSFKKKELKRKKKGECVGDFELARRVKQARVGSNGRDR